MAYVAIFHLRSFWTGTNLIAAGEYPTGTIDALKQLHISGDLAPSIFPGASVEQGDPTGLYHLIVGEGQNAFVGNGKCVTIQNRSWYLEPLVSLSEPIPIIKTATDNWGWF